MATVGQAQTQSELLELKTETFTGGTKYDELKARFELIPSAPLKQLAEVYTMGAEKYAPRQWEQGMDWGRLYAAAHRHLNAFWSGQDLDEESALPHLAHAAWNLFALMEYMETRPEFDNRPSNRHGDLQT